MKKQDIEVEGGENFYLNSSGIYFIQSIIDDRLYIGSSKNIGKRLKHHFNALNKNKHANTHLQNYFNKHGVSNLKCGVFTKCNENNLIETEQAFIDKYNISHILFNISKIAGKVEMNEEVRNKIRIKSLGKIISEEQREEARQNNLGKKHTTDSKILMSKRMRDIRATSKNYPKKSNNRKLSDEQVNEIRRLLNNKEKGYIIAKKFNVDATTISNIKNNKHYTL